MADPTFITLDRPRAIKWTHAADARLGSLDRPPALADIRHRNGRRAFYALCAWVWAGLVERDPSLAEPESLAEYLADEKAQAAALQSLVAALVAGGVIAEKKSAANDGSDSATGPSPSSNSERHAPDTTSAVQSSGPRCSAPG